jgi:hypothetical protein
MKAVNVSRIVTSVIASARPLLCAQLRTSAAASTGPMDPHTQSPRALVYDAPGEPLDVLALRELPALSAPAKGQVMLRLLQSPFNPSDINTVQGKYPLQPPLPGGVPGHEGVAEVVAVGPEVRVTNHALLDRPCPRPCARQLLASGAPVEISKHVPSG